MSKNNIRAKASSPEDEQEEIVVCCRPQDLPMFIYIVNSGILRIKDVSILTQPDVQDQISIEFGKKLSAALCREYCKCNGLQQKIEREKEDD
jgi:hypothetical protein